MFILPGPPGGDILFGASEQDTLGLATPQEIFASSRSRMICGEMHARDHFIRNGELYQCSAYGMD